MPVLGDLSCTRFGGGLDVETVLQVGGGFVGHVQESTGLRGWVVSGIFGAFASSPRLRLERGPGYGCTWCRTRDKRTGG